MQLHYITQHYTTLIALHYATLQLQLTTALHHTTFSSCGEVTTATIATTPENITPTTFRSISGFALPSVGHNNQPSYRFPIFETSATALWGTTGIHTYTHTHICIYIYIYLFIHEYIYMCICICIYTYAQTYIYIYNLYIYIYTYTYTYTYTYIYDEAWQMPRQLMPHPRLAWLVACNCWSLLMQTWSQRNPTRGGILAIWCRMFVPKNWDRTW